MEFPIQIMVVLFITIVVGGAIVSFSDNSLTDSKAKLDEISQETTLSDEEKIIEIVNINANNIAALSKQCFEDMDNSLESNICFVVLGEIQTTCLSILESIDEEYSENMYCNINTDGNSIKIYYNAPLSRVELS